MILRRGQDMRKMLRRPGWVDWIERHAAQAVPVHPNIISAAKLLIMSPLLIAAMKQADALPSHRWLVVSLFLGFCLLDWLDGVVAKHRRQATNFGAMLDRITDYPVLVAVSWFCVDILPAGLLGAKVGIDLLLIVLYFLGLGSTENRVRAGINHATLLCLLIVSQGWAPGLVTPELAIALLVVNIAFSSVVALYNLKVLQKRFVADSLSAANLLCGGFSIYFAYHGRPDVSLLFLMLGAAFDGFDGAAARKFGGTRWGVYSDDVADAVNYGIAPGLALYFTLGGVEGAVIGAAYSVFTVGRLVYFTLAKSTSDPDYFSGVPSTVGALMAICSVILFPDSSGLVGLMVGIACIQMVSFDTHYRHLGRALAAHRGLAYGMPLSVLILLAGRLFWGKELAVGIILALALVYGFMPTIASFVNLFRGQAERHGKS